MKKFKIIIALFAALIMCGCGAFDIDENAVIENNATATVSTDGNVFELKDDSVYMNGALLAADIKSTDDFLVVLGNKVYFNTNEGAKYVLMKNGKIKSFGDGRIIYARGEWVYYQLVSLFAVNAQDGQYMMLHDPALEFKEDTGEKVIFTDGEKDYSLKYDGKTLNEVE